MKHICRIQRFDYAQIHNQVSESCWLLVNLNGLLRLKSSLPSGRPVSVPDLDQPFAVLLPAGSRYDFEYGEDRENWVIELPDGAITETDSGAILVLWEGMRAEFPAFHSLDSFQAERCLEYLTRILQDYHSPDAGADTSMHLAFYALLDCVMHPTVLLEDEEPAEALRRRIVADRGFAKNLSALSFDCGYSSDHIRRLFMARFGRTPKAYRTDYRMHIARELLKRQNLSVQEVSDQLNYSHIGHFSAAFKKHVGISPKAYKAAE